MHAQFNKNKHHIMHNEYYWYIDIIEINDLNSYFINKLQNILGKI